MSASPSARPGDSTAWFASFWEFCAAYFPSSGVWNFDIANNKDLIPLGVGFGKVFKIHNVIVNTFIEPQFTVYHNGTGQPSFQLFSGVYLLFPKKKH